MIYIKPMSALWVFTMQKIMPHTHIYIYIYVICMYMALP